MSTALGTAKVPTSAQAWRRMTADQKRRAAVAFWSNPGRSEEDVADAIALVSECCHLREKKVRNASPEQRAKWTALVDDPSERMATQLVRNYLISAEAPMLKDFLHTLNIPHEGCFISQDFELSTLQPEQVRSAAATLCANHEKSATGIYFRALMVEHCDVWAPLADFLDTETPSLESFTAHGPAVPELGETGAESFTTLDDLLTGAIIAAAAGAEGAFDEDHVDDVLDEVVELNAFRHKTLFHRGFTDVIFNRKLVLHGPAENENRRRWYLCGAIVAYARKAEHARIAQLFDAEDDVKAFGRELKPRSLKVAQFVFEALCHQGRPSAAAAFLAPEMIAYAGLFDRVMHWGTRTLRGSDTDGAYSLFELLNKSLEFCSDEAREALAQTIFEIQRRTAHCLRLKRQFGSARKILENLLKNPEAPERSAMLTDIAIMSAGFRGLMDIVIPETEVSSFVRKLEQIRPQLESALAESGSCFHAQYCLGVLLVTNQKDPATAADMLEPSVSNIMRQGSVYDFGGLLSRSQFYLALSLGETLNSSHISRSLDVFCKAVEAGFIPPSHLLKRYLEALLLASSEAACWAAELAVKRLKTGKAVLDSLVEADVAADSEPVLNALLDWACNESRPGKQRFCDLQKVLRHAIRGQKLQVAEKALDSLESLARSGTCSQRFVELMADPENFDPAWGPTDAAWAAVAVHEVLGNYREAAVILRTQFHACLSSGDQGSTLEAADILERIRGYGLASEELGDLDSRLKALLEREPEMNGHAPADVPVCITVVGGDEQQVRYDESLRETFQNGSGKVDLHFRHTNWSSNHGEQFEQMRPLLNRSDCVVVLRRIRTNLGRNVRRHCSSWIGCAGDSKSSIERAIRKAVGVARTRKVPATHIAK